MFNPIQYHRVWKRWLPIMLFVLTLAGCRIFSASVPESTPLVVVAPLASPQLPDWIEQISPTGAANSLNQIRILFRDPLVPVEQLDSGQQKKLLQKFQLTPELPGQFRFLTPRMVGFQAERALPLATRIQVTLKTGLEDLNSHRLEQDLAWTFSTEPIQISNFPGLETEENPDAGKLPIDLMPSLKFNSNVELDLNSLQQFVQLLSEKIKKAIPVKVELSKNKFDPDSLPPQTQFDPSKHTWEYQITPTQPLEKASTYTLSLQPGLKSIQGNLTKEFITSSQLHTYEPLAFKTLEFYGKPVSGGAYGRFENGSPQLKFNNKIIAQSALENIKISPASPKNSPKLVQVYGDTEIVSLNPWALEPNINYQITIGAGLKDEFDQTLGKPVTLNYQTGDLAADIWAPSGLNIFPANQDLELNVSTVNLPQSKYRAGYDIVQSTDLVYTDSAYPRPGKNLLPDPEDWSSFRVKDLPNQTQETSIRLKQKLGKETGLLAYGIKARTTSYLPEKNEAQPEAKLGEKQWNEPVFYGLVQLTNLGVFAQWFPESGLVRVNHLEDGSAAVNTTVEIYQSQLEATIFPTPKPCATGTTDATGLLRLTAADLQQCMQGNRFVKPPELLVIAREDQDWAFTRTYGYSGTYGYGIFADWETNQPQSRGVIFSDRQLYQPGEKVALTGIANYFQNGQLKSDRNSSYTVTLQNPKGESKLIGQYTTNEFATFSSEFSLDSNQELGDYFVIAKAKNGLKVTGNFRVAEFKPPNFKASLTLDREIALVDETITATTQSDYLFGAPVSNANANYYVTRTATEFTPKGWEKYTFGRQWFWPEEKPSLSSDVLQKSQVLDHAGTGSQIVKIAKDLPYPAQYRVDVEVSDVSNLSVTDSKTVMALPSDRLIGLKSPFVAEAGQEFSLELIVTDPTGKPLENVDLNIELHKMDYSSVTRVVEGGQTNQNQVEYKTVAQAPVKSKATEQTVNLTPPEPGSYRIRANFTNSSNEVTATDLQIWVTGNESVFWGKGNETALNLKLDKATYQIGETATVLIQSPYPDAELYFAVIRDRPLYEKLITVQGGAPQIQFKVTPEMLPNAAVEAVLVRKGEALSTVEPGSVANLVQTGFVPFNINLAPKYLQVQVSPEKAELQPGTQQTLNLELKDAKGQPIRGQLTVMVVNDAVLQLTDYRPPNLVETVYADQSISTRFSDNRPEVVLDQMSSPLAKGWGYGGGISQAIPTSSSVRQDFQALAYYNGSVITDGKGTATTNDQETIITDATGKAKITFTIPDDLTTWRVMVVASDRNLNFGSGETTFTATKTLLANPILPQFARPRDRLLAGVSVTNNTGKKGTLEIAGSLTEELKFSAGNATHQKLKRAVSVGTQAYRFPMVAQTSGTAQVKFETRLKDQTDAFEVPLDIQPTIVTEQVIETGTTSDTATVPININQMVNADVGGLEITLASTLVPQIIAPAEQVFQQTDFPFLEPLASKLLVAANLELLSKKYNQNFTAFDLKAQTNQALEKLARLQRPDGGISRDPEQQISDPILSAYGATALAKVAQAGFVVDSDQINSLKAYLKQVLANPGKDNFCVDLICKAQLRLDILIALADLGSQSNEFIADIYGLRDEFDLVTQIKLARYLSNLPEWKLESNELVNQLQKSIYQTGQTATISTGTNPNSSYSWMRSPTVSQAEALQLFIAQNTQPEKTDALLKSLLDLRRNGAWGSTYDNAAALSALVAYAQNEPTPSKFEISVQLSGKPIGSTEFNGYQNSAWKLTIPMKELPRGKTNLTLQTSGQGRLNYLVAYRYRLDGNQPGRLNGLRVDRTIRAANETEALYRMGLTSNSKPFQVKPGQVFDIGLEIITDHPVNQVLITDPLPAGFEAIDASFQTSNPAVQAQSDSWEINYQTIHRDRVVAYGDRLEPGVYQLHYLVRSVTPGEFDWPGAEARLQYTPEEFGRSALTTLVVSEQP
ncbi:MAG: alpha-2-macroglobulin family protein [Microcoleaceae cyanobacterium]